MTETKVEEEPVVEEVEEEEEEQEEQEEEVPAYVSKADFDSFAEEIRSALKPKVEKTPPAPPKKAQPKKEEPKVEEKPKEEEFQYGSRRYFNRKRKEKSGT